MFSSSAGGDVNFPGRKSFISLSLAGEKGEWLAGCEAPKTLHSWKKSNVFWREMEGKMYLWELCMWIHVFSLNLVLNVCDRTTGSYLGVFFKGTGVAKQRARIKAVTQYCALEYDSARWIQWGQIHVYTWYIANETVHFCGCVGQAEGFWKGADSAWRKCSWCGEEGERNSFLSLLRKLSRGKPVFLSLLWSVPSDQVISAKLHGFFPGERRAVTPSFQLNSQGWYCYVRSLAN